MRKTVAMAALVIGTGGLAEVSAEGGTSGLVCIAPTYEIDAAKPLIEVESLEFYFDQGDPAAAYTVAFARVQSSVDADGKVHNTYNIGAAQSVGAVIDFTGEPAMPNAFTVVERAEIYTSTGPDEEETRFMADAVPGIACYSVSVGPLVRTQRS